MMQYIYILTNLRSIYVKYQLKIFYTTGTLERSKSKYVLYVYLCLAMQPHLSKLTPEEQQRNTHGKMRLYSFTDDEMGIHEETSHFPEVDNHVYVSLISDDDIFVPKQRLVKGLSPGYDINVYYPGFPKLHYIDHRASLKKAEVYLSLDFQIDPIFSSLSIQNIFVGESIPATIARRKYDFICDVKADSKVGGLGAAIIRKERVR